MRISTTVSDADLADLLRQGDVDAFNTIYSRYWKKLYVVASKRLHNEEEAEEIVQNIFLNLWRKRAHFRLITGFDNYFSVAVKFEVLDVMRKHAHASAYKKDLGISFSESDESTLKELDLIDLQQKLALTLSLLPEKCQLVFRLKHEKGYSQKKIAEELNISEKTVEAHLSKARKTFRNTFGSFLGTILWINL